MAQSSKGFSLIEVLVALTIFSVGVLGMLGMYGRTMSNYSDAKYRTDASMLADGLISDIWINRNNASLYAYSGTGANTTLQYWLNAVKAALPNGNAVVTVAGASATGTTVQITLTWTPPDTTTAHQHVETAIIRNP